MARSKKVVEKKERITAPDSDILSALEAMMNEEEVTIVEDNPKKNTMKEVKAGKTIKKVEPKEIDPNIMTPTDLAEELGITPYKLRAFLRKAFPTHKKGESWRFKKGSKDLQEVIDLYKAEAVKPRKAAKAKDVDVVDDDEIDITIID